MDEDLEFQRQELRKNWGLKQYLVGRFGTGGERQKQVPSTTCSCSSCVCKCSLVANWSFRINASPAASTSAPSILTDHSVCISSCVYKCSLLPNWSFCICTSSLGLISTITKRTRRPLVCHTNQRDSFESTSASPRVGYLPLVTPRPQRWFVGFTIFVVSYLHPI
jgi:hypothetical protein